MEANETIETNTLTDSEYNYLRSIDILNIKLDKLKEANLILENKLKMALKDINTKNNQIKEQKKILESYAEYDKDITQLRKENIELIQKLNTLSQDTQLEIKGLQQQVETLVNAIFSSNKEHSIMKPLHSLVNRLHSFDRYFHSVH
ncbi:MAG: hypothetical protein ACYDCN_13745 [Bacteroidia bacterium]